jgi:hypothetical protein
MICLTILFASSLVHLYEMCIPRKTGPTGIIIRQKRII